MRSQLFAAILGALGLAAFAVAAPAVSYGGSDSCALAATTVYVTAVATVTVHDSPTSYVTLGLSEPSTSTLTRFNTLYSSTTTYLAPQTETVFLTLQQTISDEEQTIVSTAEVTVTEYVQASATSAGGVASSASTSDDLLTFIVENGTTYWLNGKTPPATQSYVVQTSVVTVMPVITPVTKDHPTSSSTLTLKTTLFSTMAFTVTNTLPASTNTSTQAYIFTASSYGTVPTAAQSSWAGWNATSSVAAVLGTSVYHQFTSTFNPYSTVSFVTEESTFDIYQPAKTIISLPTYSAKSGFAQLATPTIFTKTSQSTSTPLPFSSTTATSQGSSTSNAEGQWTTAVINGQTVSWGGPGYAVSSVQQPSSLSTAVPYGNTTTYAPSGSVTSSALGVDTTCTDEQTNTLSSSAGNFTSSDPTLTSSALGVVTSSISSTSASFSASTAQALSTSYDGNITTFWTSKPMATVPIFTPSSSSAIANPGISTLSSSSPGVSSVQYSSTSQTATSVTSTKSAVPSSCGETGDFTLNFDDIPPLSIGNQSVNGVDPEPVFSPYHQFDFSGGFVVVPPPTDPYNPASAPLLTEFIPNFNMNTSTPQSGPNAADNGWSGEIGNADHGALGCFSFNVYGAKFGCDSLGPDCIFSFIGYRYDNTTQDAIAVCSQNSAIPACPALNNCDLVPINLDKDFQNLDVLRVNVTVGGEPKIWWMDDLQLGWTDNSCQKGLCRQNSRIRAVSRLHL